MQKYGRAGWRSSLFGNIKDMVALYVHLVNSLYSLT